jgi:L-ascorbate metabolism protein UlaG (beta-lactamase superfamily)
MSIMPTKILVTYLYHSGFAVQTPAHFLVFDYWRDSPKGAGLDSGVIDPAELADLDVVVFSSHSHMDHFNSVIYKWHEAIPKLRLVLSSDFRAREGVISLKPGQALTLPDMGIQTLKSNDKGVAYIVDIDGLRIYHGGDLNWWHWEGEPDDYNQKMGARFKEQIALLAGIPIDLAFLCLDPRLEEQYAWGFDHTMRTADISCAVPMHFGDDASIAGRLLQDPISEGYRDRIVPLIERGQTAEIFL